MLGAIFFIIVVIGLVKIAKFATKNPKQSIAAAKWIKGMFGG